MPRTLRGLKYKHNSAIKGRPCPVSGTLFHEDRKTGNHPEINIQNRPSLRPGAEKNSLAVGLSLFVEPIYKSHIRAYS